LFGFRKEGNSDICYNVEEPCGNYARRSKSVTKDKFIRSPFMRAVEQSNLQRQKVARWLPGAVRVRLGELLFNGFRVSVLQDERAL
jgi:hypothetical protein